MILRPLLLTGAIAAGFTIITPASAQNMPPEVHAAHRAGVVEYLNKWNANENNVRMTWAIPRGCNADLYRVEGPERWRCKGTLKNADESCINRFRYVIRRYGDGKTSHGKFRPYLLRCAG
jgi:hypothetical protein